MFSELHDRQALIRRRQRLSEKLSGRPALFASGKQRPRNYAANPYPFRAASHFLYFFGFSHPDGMGLFDGERWTLYLPDPDPDDALWVGQVPSFGELEAQLGCPVLGRSRLQAALEGREVATLPTPDLETSLELSSLLGRSVRPGVLSALDLALADAVIDLRLRHDEAAVRELARAAEITCEVHRIGMKATRPGIREAEVAGAMEGAALARGGRMAYGPIVTVHGEVLHNHHHHHTLREGDLLLVDVGAESPGGFAGDVTRTWPVSGRFSRTQRELYEVVLRAQRATIAAVKPGVRSRDLHLLAARELARGLVELGVLHGDLDELVNDGVVYLLFPHGIGHLLGLDVHDMEDLGDRAGYAPGRERSTAFGLRYLRLDRDLEPGMALTIEPGLYLVPAILEDPKLERLARGRLNRARLADFSDVRGIRIEDDVLVTEDGHQVLTAAVPADVAALEAAVLG
jgi:Xaa-Pro aminopeptidase